MAAGYLGLRQKSRIYILGSCHVSDALDAICRLVAGTPGSDDPHLATMLDQNLTSAVGPQPTSRSAAGMSAFEAKAD
jgi:hypothetical protein